MAISSILLAALAASAAGSAPASRVDVAHQASAQVSVRIIAAAASVGADRAAPAGSQPPRTATVASADGQLVPAVIFDFE